ncbi:MAG: hypothetical protein NZ870_03620, partial [bacterium]|nr:hypothetical protein [bacterium]
MGLMVLSYIFSKLSKLLSVFIFIISIVSFALYITSKYIYISHEFKISIFVVLCILFFVYFTKTVLSLRYKKILEYIEKDLSIEKGSITGFVDYKKNKFFGSKELADEYVRSIYEFIVSKRKFIVKKNVKQILYLSPLLPISLLILLFVSEQGFSIRRQSFYDIFDVIPQDKVRYVDKFSTVDFILKPKIKKNVVAVVDGKKFNGEFDGSNYFFKFEAYKDMEIVFFAGVYSDKYKIKVLNEVGF